MQLSVGDRVSIRLREVRGLAGGKSRYVDVGATVEDIDIPGVPPGVLLRLDRTVNGLITCYATRDEIKLKGKA